MRSQSGSIMVIWEMASLGLVSMTSRPHETYCSCLLLKSAVLCTQVEDPRVGQKEYNDITKKYYMLATPALYPVNLSFLTLEH